MREAFIVLINLSKNLSKAIFNKIQIILKIILFKINSIFNCKYIVIYFTNYIKCSKLLIYNNSYWINSNNLNKELLSLID